MLSFQPHPWVHLIMQKRKKKNTTTTNTCGLDTVWSIYGVGGVTQPTRVCLSPSSLGDRKLFQCVSGPSGQASCHSHRPEFKCWWEVGISGRTASLSPNQMLYGKKRCFLPKSSLCNWSACLTSVVAWSFFGQESNAIFRFFYHPPIQLLKCY